MVQPGAPQPEFHTEFPWGCAPALPWPHPVPAVGDRLLLTAQSPNPAAKRGTGESLGLCKEKQPPAELCALPLIAWPSGG